MMDEIEDRLRRYRPAAPPPALRARVVEAVRQPRGSIVAWFPAAAAVILIVLFSWMSSIERERIDARIPQAADGSAPALTTETWP